MRTALKRAAYAIRYCFASVVNEIRWRREQRALPGHLYFEGHCLKCLRFDQQETPGKCPGNIEIRA